MMKRLLYIFIVCGSSLSLLSAVEAGVSIGTFSGGTNFNLIDAGTYVSAGLIVGISQRVEFESSLVGQITPNPLDTLVAKTSFSYALLAPSYYLGDKDPLYLNMWLSLGVIHQIPFDGSWGPFITFTPLTTGGSQFLRKERVASLSLYYDIPSEKIGFFFQLFTLDFYFH